MSLLQDWQTIRQAGKNIWLIAKKPLLITSQVDGGTPGWLRVSGRSAGTSFTITSSSGTDTPTVGWQMLEP